MDKVQLAQIALENRERAANQEILRQAECEPNEAIRAEMVRTLLERREKVIDEAKAIAEAVGAKDERTIADHHFIDSSNIPLGKLPVPDPARPIYAFASISVQQELEPDPDLEMSIKTARKRSWLPQFEITVERIPTAAKKVVNARCTIEYWAGDENGDNLDYVDIKGMALAAKTLEGLSPESEDSVLAQAYDAETHSDIKGVLNFLGELESLKPYIPRQEQTA